MATTLDQAETILRTRASMQTVPHLAYLYRYSADALRAAKERSPEDRRQDAGHVAIGLAIAVRGSPEAADVADVVQALAEPEV